MPVTAEAVPAGDGHRSRHVPGVKVPGDIRTGDDVLKVIAADTTRVGAAATPTPLDELPAQ